MTMKHPKPALNKSFLVLYNSHHKKIKLSAG